MPGGPHVVLREGDLTGAVLVDVDDERRAQHTLHRLAVQGLGTVGAVGLQHLAVGVGQQREAEVLHLSEAGELLRAVGGDAHHLVAGLGEVTQGRVEIDSLDRAPGCHGGRVEVDDDPSAGKATQGHRALVGVQKGEGWGGVAGMKLGHAPTLIHPDDRGRLAAAAGGRGIGWAGQAAVATLEETMANPIVRTREDIEADIEAARQRLAGNVESLINQVHPKAIVANTVADARAFAEGTFDQAKAQVVDERGNLRTERVALLAAAAGGAVTFILVVRSILKGR